MKELCFLERRITGKAPLFLLSAEEFGFEYPSSCRKRRRQRDPEFREVSVQRHISIWLAYFIFFLLYPNPSQRSRYGFLPFHTHNKQPCKVGQAEKQQGEVTQVALGGFKHASPPFPIQDCIRSTRMTAWDGKVFDCTQWSGNLALPQETLRARGGCSWLAFAGAGRKRSSGETDSPCGQGGGEEQLRSGVVSLYWPPAFTHWS